MSEDKIPKQAGIGKLIDLGENALNCGGLHASRSEQGRSLLSTTAIDLELGENALNCCGLHASRNEKGRSHLNTIAAIKVKKRYVLVLGATLSATALYIAAFNIPDFIPKAKHINDYDSDQILQHIRDSTFTLPFILLNSAGFVVSLAIIISVLGRFPMKPWPQIPVFMFLFSYVTLIMKILPWASMLVLGFSVPLLILAAAGKVFKFDE